VTPDTLLRSRATGVVARAYLLAHDSYTFFDCIGDFLRAGPTLTNVNDIRAILIT
jgi:hydroxypyruvate reductase